MQKYAFYMRLNVFYLMKANMTSVSSVTCESQTNDSYEQVLFNESVQMIYKSYFQGTLNQTHSFSEYCRSLINNKLLCVL